MLAIPPLLDGRYRVMGRLGQGAIAEVVRAQDEQTGQTVALKILYPSLRESAVVVERFRREVELVRRIVGAHVLAIRALGESDGLLYLVMDHHPGGDLADRLARGGPLAHAALALLARQLCAALAAAHAVGIVHRDVKPSNVLVGAGTTDMDMDLRLCDFGLARSADGAGLTTAAAVLGTPEYMAPEVIADGYADPRSDLYSLGVVLFEAATGRLPFFADSPYHLMRQHLDSPPPEPRALAPQLPVAFERAILRLLAKDPLDRFGSAAAVAHAFGDVEPDANPGLPAPRRRAGDRPCPRCGGWLIELASVCGDCGARTLHLQRARPGVSVLVTGPGNVGARLEGRLQVALFRLLQELPPEWAPRDRVARRGARLPFFVARRLTPASAAELVARIKAAGLYAEVHTRFALSAAGLHQKFWVLSGRSVAASYVASSVILLTGNLMHGLAGELPLAALAVMAGVGLGVIPALTIKRALRPLLAGPRADAPGLRADARLGSALASIRSRQDRRLLGRIFERQHELRTGGAVDTGDGGVGNRAADLAEALAAVEDADAALTTAPLDNAAAQGELRRLERGRTLVRAELLHLAGRLEALTSRLEAARAAQGELATCHAVRAIDDLADDLTMTAEAHAELEAFLARQRPVPV
jgi:tRNA A-37 threonylcarbamoyl transferase component Bud32